MPRPPLRLRLPARVACHADASHGVSVSSATGLDGVNLIEYEIINKMCFLVSIFLARLNALVEVCCQGKTGP